MLVINDESLFKINTGVSVCNVRNKAYFILDTRTGSQYDLTEMEYLILNEMARGMSVHEIAIDLKRTYNAPEKEIEEDLKNYAEQLLKNGLISTL